MDEKIKAYFAVCQDQYVTVASEILAYEFSGLFAGENAFANISSPIEQLMLVGLMYGMLPRTAQPKLDFSQRAGLPRAKACRDPYEPSYIDEMFPEYGVAIFPQHRIGRYRADFLVAAKVAGRKDQVLVVVECDGHDHHERTKEQAERDRSRDRAMQSAGYTVFRFTGAEIWRNTGKCVQEVMDFIASATPDHEAFR